MMNDRTLRIAIACGGTGGHTYPGLATGKALRSLGHDVVILQAGRAIETQTLSGWDGEIFKTGARQSKLSIPGSLMRTWREFGRRRPNVLVAMGSYTSLPPVVAAWLRGIPVVLHEANAIPGKAIAVLARFAKSAGIAFPEAADYMPKRVKVENVGLPLRSEFAKGTGTSKTEQGKFTLLVMGGSQGAVKVNELVVGALKEIAAKYPELASKLRVVHLTGPKNLDAVRELYTESGLKGPAFEQIGYSNEMSKLYSQADFCISRSGASSCLELALAGLPVLFIPMPHLAGDHQTFNAKSMANRGAGEWKAQESLASSELADYLVDVASNTGKRVKMREALLAVSRSDAANQFAKVIVDVARG